MKFVVGLVALLLTCILVLMPFELKIGHTVFTRPKLDFKVGSFRFARDLEFKLGLDLQGGSHLVYEADVSKLSAADKKIALDATRANIERRVNLLGVSESVIQTAVAGDSSRLIIELPGVKDVKQALATIGETAKLQFAEVLDASPSASASPSAQTAQFNPTDLTGSDLKTAVVQFGGQGKSMGTPVISISFTADGAKKFADLTRKNLGKPLAIFLDNQLVSAPTVQNEITTGQAIISGGFTLDEAKRLAVQLNAGSLPVSIKVIEQRNIGATLGSESVTKSLFAGLIGLALIWIFMAANYGKNGIIANVALLIYILISLSIFKLIPITLTLAGIAGFILSVGVAVDANILVFERMKEELRWGRPKKVALELAFHRAWSSIRDSNISSAITASILFWFGSGPVRGFALTLIIGILVSLFTSITITRNLLRISTK